MPEIEYHVQEFEEGENGGWWSLLQTSDLAEAKAYLAEQDSDEAVAVEIATYGVRARRRLMAVTLTPIDEPDHLRIALRKVADGLRSQAFSPPLRAFGETYEDIEGKEAPPRSNTSIG